MRSQVITWKTITEEEPAAGRLVLIKIKPESEIETCLGTVSMYAQKGYVDADCTIIKFSTIIEWAYAD